MHTVFDIPADLDTPVSAYLKLAPFGRRFLLESVGGEGREARYSLLGFGEADDVRLSAPADSTRSGADPSSAQTTAEYRASILDGFRVALDRAPVLAHADGDVPFTGGLVGVAGFELARAFERLPRGVRAAPGVPDYIGCAPHSVLAFDHATRRMGLLAAGSEAERRRLREDVMRALRGPIPTRSNAGTVATLTPNMERGEFLELVRRAQDAIAAGDAYQLVLSIRFSGPCDIDPIDAYRALRLIDPSPYMFLFESDDVAVVGASPETLVRVENDRAFVQPIAGTRPRHADRAEDLALENDLRADAKEAAEHVMLVDLARSDLGRVAAPGTIVVEPYRTVRRFREVMHLVSGVHGDVEPAHDAFDVFAATFPAGTVVGAPKVNAMQWIDEHEPSARGFYAGSVGTFGHGGTANQAITIRTAVFQAGEVSVQAGAGIVIDSVPENEHAEILSKARAMRAALEFAAGGLS